MSATVQELLMGGIAQLRAAEVPDAPRDARLLLAAALGIDRSRLTLVMPDRVAPEAAALFDSFIAARTTRQPVSQILGRREFYGREFRVTPDVLDPRPETEHLVELALSTPFETLLDLGTGSGCILATLLAENPTAKGQGADISPAAIAIAQENAHALGVADRAQFTSSDWFENIAGTFDLIVSNPPYISIAEMAELAPDVRDHEPHLALTPGGDGLESYRIIAQQAAEYLVPKGRLIVEIGATQAADVMALFRSAGFVDVTSHQDYAGHDRLVSAKSPQ